MATSWDDLAVEIAHALGVQPDQVPKPGTEDFLGMLSRLHDTHPDLEGRVTAYLVGQGAPPTPTFAQMRKEATRAGLLQRLWSWAFKRDPTQSGRRRSNRSLLFPIVGVLILALMVAVNLVQPSKKSAAPSRKPGATAQHAAPPSRVAPSTTEPGAPSLPSERTQPPAPSKSGTAGVTPLPTPPLPSVPSASGPATAPPPITTVSPPAEKQSEALTVVSSDGPADTTAKLVIVGPANTMASGGGANEPQPGTAQGGSAPGQAGGLTVVTPAQAQSGAPGQAGQAAPGQAQAGQPAAPAIPRLQIGDQFIVTLTTPIAMSTDWQSIPVVAIAATGPLQGWEVIGHATLAQDGTPQITWSQAISPDGKATMGLNGIAYDPKTGIPGVSGAKPKPMTPQAARTTLSGTLAAVGQYVQAQINAQQTQVSGLTATITSQVPPFWQFVASQLATGFQPGPVQTGGTVLVTEIPAETPITVFITQTIGT